MTIPCEPLCHFSGRLYFTSFPHPPPRPETLNSASDEPDSRPTIRGPPQPSTSATPEDDAKYYYFTVDDQMHYLSFFQDWGPLNLAMVYKACILIHELLQDKDLSSFRLVLYSSSDPRRKANAALLMALYILIVERRPPWEAFHPIAEVEFMPFRDAGRGRSDFNLSIQDCLWGMWKAMHYNLCDMNEFDVDDYEYYEKVENGDWNWLTPNFIAFASPVDPTWLKREKEKKAQEESQAMGGLASPTKGDLALQRRLPVPFQNCLDYFEKKGVKLVVRLNNPLYDRQVFLDRGINHTELYFDDGTNPSDEIVRNFIDMADEVVEAGGVVAVHCKAGLGRTGTLIGAYLTWKYGFTAPEAIAFMRIVRPGSVVGPQQQFMYSKHIQWAQWAAIDEHKRSQAVTLISRTEIVTPITPPEDADEDDNMVTDITTSVSTTIPIILPTTPPSKVLPPTTPHRHIAIAAARAKAMSPPGQPRKTPAAKRNSAVLDSDEEDMDEDRDVLPALSVASTAVRRVRPKPASSHPLGARVTASEQRPTRVTRSTAAATTNRRPGTVVRAATSMSTTRTTRAHPNGQAPSKVPRLANGTTARGTAAAKATGSTNSTTTRRLRKAASPSPSRLPTLIPSKRGNQNQKPMPDGVALKGEWISNNTAAVVVPRSKSERPALRPTRRRRSSFSSVDVVA